MSKTKNIGLEVVNDFDKFVNEMNKINDEHENIFATQTHVTQVNGEVVYSAIFFERL